MNPQRRKAVQSKRTKEQDEMSFKSELDKAISQYDATEKRMTAIQLNPISKEDAKGWSPLNELQSELMQWGSRIRILENQISAMD